MRIVEEQCRKWEMEAGKKKTEIQAPVITISREAGSIGRFVARKLSEDLEMTLYGSDLLNEVAKDAGVMQSVVRTLDERGRSWLEDLMATWGGKNNLSMDAFFQSLVRTIGAIGRHGRAVILGRGATFILPPPQNLRVRFIAPLEMRIKSVIREFKLNAADAERRIRTLDEDRRAFVKKYFDADIDDPGRYDLVVNNEFTEVDEAVEIIKVALKSRRWEAPAAGRRAAFWR